MRIGTTSFSYRYLLLEPGMAPPLESIVQDARRLGLDILQICENARPLSHTPAEWDTLSREAASIGIELQLGCRTLEIAEFAACLERALLLPRQLLRIVLEIENGPAPTAAQVDAFLQEVWQLLEPTTALLAIENHFDVPAALLAEAVLPYPPDRVGFCVDTANSLRNFESPGQVLRLLGDRAFCYHLKDFDIIDHQPGFSVQGARLGAGRLDVQWFLNCIPPDADVLLENWVPATDDTERDIYADAEWLQAGLRYIRS